MAWSTEISQLVTETEQFIAAVETKKLILDAGVDAVTLDAAEALAVVAPANTSAVNSTTSADISKGHAVATEAITNLTKLQQDTVSDAERQASLAAGYALNAGSIVQQDLSGLNTAALHRSPGSVTSMFIYDTSKDSDGGAWTEKCQNTSWYNEDISGKWLGLQTSELNARYEGGNLGPELATGWFDGPSGWSVSGAVSVISGGSLSIAAGENMYRFTGLPRATYYVITFDVTNITGGGFAISVNNAGDSISPITTNGQKSVRIFDRNGGSGGYVLFVSSSSGTATISNLSIKEVTPNTVSNDYFKLTTDGKFYRLWKNLFPNTADLSNVTWSLSGMPTPTDVGGGRFKLIPTNALVNPSGLFWGRSIGTTLNAQGSRTFSIDVFPSGYNYALFGIFDRVNVWALWSFDLTTGAIVENSSANGPISGTATSQALVGGGYRLTLSFAAGTALDGSAWIGVAPHNTGDFFTSASTFTAWTPDGVSGIEIARPQLEFGSVATTYEVKSAANASISEVFRGNKRDFPRVAGIVTELSNLTIYDLTEPGRPMWMRFWGNTGSSFLGWVTTPTINGVTALNGNIIPIATTGSMGGVILNFAKDDVITIWNGSYVLRKRQIIDRNALNLYSAEPGGFVVANSTINAIAMTVLSDAPTDPVTGLKVPTIAVATNGGLSIIKHNGTVVNGASTAAFSSITLSPSLLSAGRGDFEWYYALNPGNLGTAFVMSTKIYTVAPDFGRSNTTRIINGARRGDILRVATGAIVQRLRNNETTIGRGLASTITNTYNTGWQPGDIKTTLLTETNTSSATEQTSIVTNGDFSTDDVSFWSVVANATTAVVSNRLELTATANYGGIFSSMLYGDPGGLYWMEGELVSGTGRFTISGSYWDPDFGNYDRTGPYKFEGFFRTRLSDGFFQPNLRTAVSGATTVWDNIKIIKVDEDRSYNNQGAIVKGSLTRTPVATGSSLVGYSGFSSANYLQQPYNEKLEFGIGDWSASAWVNIPVTLPASLFPVFGPELINNGDFSNASTGWTLGTGWSVSGNQLVATSVAIGIDAKQSIPSLVGGSFYLISFDVVVTSGALKINLGQLGFSPTEFYVSSSGTYTYRTMYYGLQPAQVTFWPAAVFTGSVDNISVKQVSPTTIFDRTHLSGTRIRLGVGTNGFLTATAFDGTTTRIVTTTAAYNTAQWLKAETTYTTDGSLAIRVNGREVAVTRGNPLLSLSSRYNLLNHSERFDTTVWAKRLATAPLNVLTATATNGDHSVTNYSYISTVTGLFTATVTAKQGTSQYLWITLAPAYGLANYATVIVDLIGGTVTKTQQNGVVTISATTSISAPDVDGYRTINMYISSSIAGMGIVLGIAPNATAGISTYGSVDFAATGTETILLKNAQLQTGPSALQYQLVDPVPQGATVVPTNFNFAAPMTIGNNYTIDAPFPGSIALLKLSATAPTIEQSTFMYEQEKQLFRTDAISVLPDAASILDISYDDATDRWSTISATNESYWSGLIRNSVTPVPSGTYSKISTTSGMELTSRITTIPGVDITIPTYLLRDDLNKRAEAASKAFKELVNFDYVGGFTASTTIGSTAITSVANLTYPVSPVGARISGTGIPTNATIVAVVGTTIYISAPATATATGVLITFLDFILPSGFEAETVTSAGAIRREGTTADFTRLFDGFIEAIRFAVAPGVTAWVQIQAAKIVS